MKTGCLKKCCLLKKEFWSITKYLCLCERVIGQRNFCSYDRSLKLRLHQKTKTVSNNVRKRLCLRMFVDTRILSTSDEQIVCLCQCSAVFVVLMMAPPRNTQSTAAFIIMQHLIRNKTRNTRTQRLWLSHFLKTRKPMQLLVDLRREDGLFTNFMRMSSEDFGFWILQVGSIICRKDL